MSIQSSYGGPWQNEYDLLPPETRCTLAPQSTSAPAHAPAAARTYTELRRKTEAPTNDPQTFHVYSGSKGLITMDNGKKDQP